MPRQPELISQVYLKIDGTDVSDEVMQSLISLEVDDNLNLPDTFVIHIRDPQLQRVDSDMFSLGKSVEVSARGDNRTVKLMDGEITAVEPRISRDALPTLFARGYDKCHRLNREKKTRSFNQVTDSDIASSIAREAGLRASVDTTREVHEYVLQDNQTDWEFLWERAKRISFRVFVEGLGGSQFAFPGAVDRLRAAADRAGVDILAAADPANPYGAALPWPDHDAGRPSRSAGAQVILIDGRLAAFVERDGRKVLTFADDPVAVAAALADLAERTGRRRVISTVDGEPAQQTPLGAALLTAGFVASYKGLAHR